MMFVPQKVIMVVFQKNKPYNTDIQIQAMRARYPQFKAKKNEDGTIVFIGNLQVKPELPVYTIKIIYKGNFRPQVFILDPIPDPEAPHIFSDSESLCLYHQKDYKWNKKKLIATDIMGWVAGWIYFYEYWLQSGEWIGPEVSHNI